MILRLLPLLPVLLAGMVTHAAEPVVFYAGGGSQTRFLDVFQCDDGTVLALGGSNSLDWLPQGTPVREIPAPELPVSFGSEVAYLLHLSGNLEKVLEVVHLPTGTVKNLRWIRSTSLPGQPTGALFLSGEISGGYFIGRLDANFVEGAPTGFQWLRKINAANGHEIYQPWDVGADGSVVYGYGGENGATIGFLDADGMPRALPALRASHHDGNAFVRGIGGEIPGAQYSAIRLPTDMQSWDDEELLAKTPDGNGGVRQGTWPIDIMITRRFSDNSPLNVIAGREYGYNGYRTAGRHWIGAVSVDRTSGDFYVGFNIKSLFWDAGANKEQPDFEPAVIAYQADGTMKWWNRLYTEAVDANLDGTFESTYVSPPDQYIDGLAIDYAVGDGEPQLLVAARCHGNNTSNFWSGNEIAANPGGNAFQNRFSGTEGNIHITWLGRLRGEDGQVLRASYLAGFFRKIINGKGNWPTVPYSQPIHDGWPDHNVGWPDVTTTRIEANSLRVAPDGRPVMVGTGPRMVTTRNAFQKLPRRLGHNNPVLDEGTCPWNHWVRAYEPNLNALAYSSALTGVWTYPNGDISADPVGASNTVLRAALAVDGGILVAGQHSNQAAATSFGGNAIPTANVPDWGSGDYSGVTGILAFLPFHETAPAPAAPAVEWQPSSPSAPAPRLRVETRPLRAYRLERSLDGSSWSDTGERRIGNGQQMEWVIPAELLSESALFRIVGY